MGGKASSTSLSKMSMPAMVDVDALWVLAA